MTSATTRRRLPRFMRDFALGLALFAVVSVTGLCSAPTSSGWLANPAQARLYEVETTTEELAVAFALGLPRSDPVNQLRQQILALTSLGLAFAGLFAFNLWFARHLRAVHSAERRRRA